MPEVNPEHVPNPIAVIGWDGTRYNVIGIDNAFHVQVDVITAVLAVGAATAANQALILAQLQLIEDMRDALQSVATDRLIVRGEDQLFSFKSVLTSRNDTTPTADDGWSVSESPGAGEIWVVTSVVAWNEDRPTTEHRYYLDHDGVSVEFYVDMHAIATDERTCWGGFKYLDEADVIAIRMLGCLAADQVIIDLTGYIMTLET